MVAVQGLTKRFRGMTVVDKVSFEVRPGEVTGYLGPNGSGKSTTVKMMAGLLHPSEGHVLYRGADSSSVSGMFPKNQTFTGT
jgi:ABC-2 type transport system ATP-binding protein